LVAVLDYIKNKQKPLNIAHRGGMGLYPENTLQAFHASLTKHQVDILEMDIQITRDGKAVVFHDSKLDRTTNGKGRVCDHSYQEISQLDAGYRFTDKPDIYQFRGKGITVPLLEDVLEQFPTTYLNLELKDRSVDLIYEVRRVINKFDAKDHIIVGSEKFVQNRKIHRIITDCCHYFSQVDIYCFILWWFTGLSDYYWEKFNVVEIPLKRHGIVVYPLLQKAAEEMNLPLFVWGANDTQSIERLKADKVDGIITDHPDLV
tara:strand:- start:4888 stop:5667 length:780 start_codon:yes stop_codon:yes gene_type:complete